MSRRESKHQEHRIAKDVKGQTQAGSGSGWHAKGDVRKIGVWRIEAKQTGSYNYTLKRRDIIKIQQEAAKAGEYWSLVIEWTTYRVQVVAMDVLLAEELGCSKGIVRYALKSLKLAPLQPLYEQYIPVQFNKLTSKPKTSAENDFTIALVNYAWWMEVVNSDKG